MNEDQMSVLVPCLFLFLPLLAVAQSSMEEANNYVQRYSDCAPVPYTCGNLQFNLSYPFMADIRHDYCGHPGYYVNCSDNALYISIGNNPYQVKKVDSLNHLLQIVDTNFVGQSCPASYPSTTLNSSLFEYSERNRNLTLYANCTASSLPAGITPYEISCLLDIPGKHSYYRLDNGSFPDPLGMYCISTVVIPMTQVAAGSLASGNMSLWAALQEGFFVKWTAGRGWCDSCVDSGGHCGYNSTAPDEQTCYCPDGAAIGRCGGGNSKKQQKSIIIGVCGGIGGFILLGCVLFSLLYRQKKRARYPTSTPLVSIISSQQSFEKEPKLGSTDYPTHIFSYDELLEATNCFDASQEIGDGGFGTVYKGKLRDGRVVAVKRLYENNYKRVEQFMNEIEILSRLRHPNLVSLYGCTSQNSRDLLLVYEYVPNGTVADHLRGPRAAGQAALTWCLRMKIAIETAEALAYLHTIEPPVIHRDVKTNNILLDDSFHVKVADFGLSRLFPANATHVSTAPQGTPGYLDPEYHQCYQLTDKSDVYSFGVVLVELISSKQAVDINRKRSEVNLATMALSRIQKQELDSLVDPGLGYQSDSEVKRMVTLVAELAFRCLQADRDIRPPIKEVLAGLKGILNGDEYRSEKVMMGTDDVHISVDAPLLKGAGIFSPNSVTEKWESISTTPGTAGSSDSCMV